MYLRTFWIDHVVDQHGVIIQQGTLLDQLHFNNLELGLSDQAVAAAFLMFRRLQMKYNTAEELHTVTLTGNGNPWPFNNDPVSVMFTQLRENTNYFVEIDVKGYSGGLPGHICVCDRTMNGFKLLHDGSATSVQVSVRVCGGFI